MWVCSLVAPSRPPVKKKTGKYYTIHYQPNNVFGVRPKEDMHTCMVGFKKYEDAHTMGRMLETFYMNHQMLPLADALDQFALPSTVQDLRHLSLVHNDIEDLLAWCKINFLDFLAVDEIEQDVNKYIWEVALYHAEDDFELFKERLDYLISL